MLRRCRHCCSQIWTACTPAIIDLAGGGKLSPWTLRFSERGLEVGYLSKSSRYGGFAMAALASATVTLHEITRIFVKYPTVAGNEIKQFQQVVCLVVVVYGLAIMSLSKIPPRSRFRNQAVIELAWVSYILVLFLGIVGTNKYHLATIRGDDPFEVFGYNCFNDSHLLLLIDAVITGSHLMCPVRWCLLLFTELTAISCYIVLTFLIGSPDRDMAVFNMLCLAGLIAGASVGKRNMELRDRTAFAIIIYEKGERCAAEFQLEQKRASAMQQVSNADVALASSAALSNCSMGTSDRCFRSQQDDGGPEMLISKGRKEQWIIEDGELKVSPSTILGKGGFGVVLAGSFHGAPVAVKASKLKGANLMSCLNELRVLRKLRHQNIVLFYGSCVNTSSGEILLVMEFVDGERLDSFMLGGDGRAAKSASIRSPPDNYSRCQVLSGLSSGLLYLHTRLPPVIHSDLKPENVFVERHGRRPRAKLMDFGLARVVTSHVRPQGGTLRWSAPEVLARQQSYTPHISSDVFSFGRLIFFCATGWKPLDGIDNRRIRTLAQTMKVPKLSWPPLSEFQRRCRLLADCCLQIDPKSRWCMSNIYETISNWPEHSCLSDGSFEQLIAKVSASSSSGDVTATSLWDNIDCARKGLRPPSGSFHERIDAFFKTRSRRREHNVELELQSIPESQIIANGPSAAPQPEEPLLAIGGLRVTPPQTMKREVIFLITRWNYRLPSSPCCRYHAALDILHSMFVDLRDLPCRDMPVFDDAKQCSECGMLEIDSQSSDDFKCLYCGHANTKNVARPTGATTRVQL
mmetsp:Transcript_40393/g.71611  ORF Transcript_40393/g.71611 Transcript_40393/m.71611 type:complete len:802 (+) Transcript_40393:84-2489(+)